MRRRSSGRHPTTRSSVPWPIYPQSFAWLESPSDGHGPVPSRNLPAPAPAITGHVRRCGSADRHRHRLRDLHDALPDLGLLRLVLLRHRGVALRGRIRDDRRAHLRRAGHTTAHYGRRVRLHHALLRALRRIHVRLGPALHHPDEPRRGTRHHRCRLRRGARGAEPAGAHGRSSGHHRRPGRLQLRGHQLGEPLPEDHDGHQGGLSSLSSPRWAWPS